jgi:hypothetical protein
VTFGSTAAGWAPLTGTGCAHYVAHILNVRRGTPGISACDLGFTIKVPMLVQGMPTVKPALVQVNDIWVNQAQSHCGIVVAVQPVTGKNPKITISQCSSNEAAGRLGVNQQDWATFFHGQGSFYRSYAAGAGPGAMLDKTGIDSFGRLVEQVLLIEPYRSASRVLWAVDSGSFRRGKAAIGCLRTAYRKGVLVPMPVHISWRNQVKIYFSITDRKRLTPERLH